MLEKNARPRGFLAALLTFSALAALALASSRVAPSFGRDLVFRSIVAASAGGAGLFILLGSRGIPGSGRAGWRWISAAMFTTAVTHVALVPAEVAGTTALGTAVGTVGGIAAGSFGLIGLVRLGIRTASTARLLNVVIDAVITGLSVLVVTWVLVLEQFMRPGDRPSPSLVVWASLGVGLGAVVLQQISRVPRSWFGPMLLLVGAAAFAMVASIAGGEIGVGYASAMPLPSLLFIVAFGLAAIAPMSGVWGTADKPAEPWFLQRVLPYLAALAAIVAVLIRYVSGGLFDKPVAVIGGVIAICVVLRQLVATFDEREHRRALVHEATHDFLTQLPNRMVLQQRLEVVLRRRPDHHRRHAVLIIDVDEFKSVNDALSHEIGDLLLQSVGERVRACMRPTDVVTRLGGDEFAVLLENASLEETTLVCTRICEQVGEPHMTGPHELRVTCSIGVGWSRPGEGPADLLRKADAAMYVAKHHGKGSFRIFDAGIENQARQRLDLLQSVAQATAAGQLRLLYQPIVELRGGALIGAEALLRWFHSDRGWVSIGEATDALEGTHLLTNIDTWVLREACSQLAVWHASGWPLALHVNVSAHDATDPGFPATLSEILSDTGAPASHLTLEVTESAAYATSTSANQILEELRALGVAISIDDFGTGYSALKRILDHKFDSLKIDRSFVLDYGTPPGSAIIETISAMGDRVGLRIIAEGIETADQARGLTALGCRYGQGFLYSPPLEPAVLEAQYRPGGSGESELIAAVMA